MFPTAPESRVASPRRTGRPHSASRSPVIVPEQAAQPVTALDLAGNRSDLGTTVDDFVAQPLVIPFHVVMLDLFDHCTPQGWLTEDD